MLCGGWMVKNYILSVIKALVISYILSASALFVLAALLYYLDIKSEQIRIGMLITYYFVAFITKGVYSNIIIIGWTIFALCSPIFAYFTWMTKEKGIFPKIISICIILVSIISTIVLFDRLRFYDFIINGIMVYYLFFKNRTITI